MSIWLVPAVATLFLVAFSRWLSALARHEDETGYAAPMLHHVHLPPSSARARAG